jgi:hypothetical protein
MSTNTSKAAPSAAQVSIDWRRVVSTACIKCDWTSVARVALGSNELTAMVGEALRMIGRSIEADIARAEAEGPPPPPPPIEPVPIVDESAAAEAPRVEAETPKPPISTADEAAMNAATLLGVAIDASTDEIRSALRARLSSSKLHPDQGGDGEEAKRLIAAKNRLVERIRAARK